MENRIEEKDKYLYTLHRWLYYSEMLAAQCNAWLSAEEGNENMVRNIKKKKKLTIDN